MVNIDPKRVQHDGREVWEVHINGGRVPTGLEAVAWAREVERLGAGEIVLTSMDADGTKDGYDLEMTAAVSEAVDDPGRRQRRGRPARAPGRRDHASARPTPPWPPAFSTSASTRFDETKRHHGRAGHSGPLVEQLNRRVCQRSGLVTSATSANGVR